MVTYVKFVIEQGEMFMGHFADTCMGMGSEDPHWHEGKLAPEIISWIFLFNLISSNVTKK